jgi:two-component system sensor histidine kinase AgrC
MNNITIFKSLAILLIILIVLLAIFLLWKQKFMVYLKQEEELRLYKLYVKPLEEFIKEIRARQHEFDNHLNALLSMHLTIDNYEELVKSQAEYIRELISLPEHNYQGLLKISNKVLAGFLYSKIIASPPNVSVELIVGSKDIFTNVPEMDAVEVLGTLIDNAFEACGKEEGNVKIYLTSEDDRLIFIIKNRHDKIPINELSRFFERGYSTKNTKKNQGFGLYNANRIMKHWGGDIYVENEIILGDNYVSFHVEF